jgi:hypothetical protein
MGSKNPFAPCVVNLSNPCDGDKPVLPMHPFAKYECGKNCRHDVGPSYVVDGVSLLRLCPNMT